MVGLISSICLRMTVWSDYEEVAQQVRKSFPGYISEQHQSLLGREARSLSSQSDLASPFWWCCRCSGLEASGQQVPRGTVAGWILMTKQSWIKSLKCFFKVSVLCRNENCDQVRT